MFKILKRLTIIPTTIESTTSTTFTASATFTRSFHTSTTPSSSTSSTPRYIPPFARRNERNEQKEGQRPTHFLAFKITDTNTINFLTEIQQKILEKVPASRSMAINPSRFHITLFVMYLPTKDHRKDAHTALESCTKLFNQFFPTGKECFTVKGLNNFQKCRVIWAGVEQESSIHLSQFVQRVQTVFADHRINFDTKPFQPHITLFKDKRKPGIKAPSSELHSLFLRNEFNFKSETFGVQPINGVEFVCMDEMDDHGFYKAIGKLHYDTQNSLAKYLSIDNDDNNNNNNSEWENLDEKYNNLFYYNTLPNKKREEEVGCLKEKEKK